jgi:D-alanyl-D-alanine carboxypeptidase/D-alanyl-D-alanine-endopeptidase (penicillin-binding protein 4)
MRGWRIAAALLVAGCAARGAPRPLAPELAGLLVAYDSAFDAPEFSRATWGVVIASLEDGRVVYRRNAGRLFLPASNTKILTGAAALLGLGADFRYATPVLARGRRSGDTLHGDLLVVGRGDPTLSQRATGGEDVLAALRPWADSLRARGVRVITGRVAGDAGYFPDPIWGEGWMWDDLSRHYSAPVGALQFNEGFAVLEISPGDSVGAPAFAALRPSSANLRVVSEVVTAPPDTTLTRILWGRSPFGDSTAVAGLIAAGSAPMRLQVAVPDPARYFEVALTQALRESGITLLEQAIGAPPSATGQETLFVWRSRPLAEILPLFLKPSQNQIGEALLRTLGGERTGEASVDSGRAAARSILRELGVPDDACVLADGSGLSRYNFVAPDAVAAVLLAMSQRPEFQVFYDALAVMGVDGTLETRLVGSAAAGNVHAKTGTMRNVRNLSGYVTTADGERLVFVLLANNFTVPFSAVELVQDFVVESLANLRRRSRR